MLARLEKPNRAAHLPPDAVNDEIEQLHYPIIKWCKEQVPEVPYIRARSDKESTIGKGAPDFTIFYRGRCILVECKSRTGTVSPDQIAWKMRAEAHQFNVNVVYSMSQFLDLVK